VPKTKRHNMSQLQSIVITCAAESEMRKGAVTQSRLTAWRRATYFRSRDHSSLFVHIRAPGDYCCKTLCLTFTSATKHVRSVKSVSPGCEIQPRPLSLWSIGMWNGD